MMIGEPNRLNPTVHVPPWNLSDDPVANLYFPFSPSDSDYNANGGALAVGCGSGGVDYSDNYSPLAVTEALAALQRYLPSNDAGGDGEFDSDIDASDTIDSFSCDQFRMFEFKVRRCVRARSHDWTDCPYAHPGEKARRRDPRKYHYSGAACPDFRKGSCRKGDACEYAHGVFECWLHPARYRTQPCKDGIKCRRRVCFFAHTPEQLRVLPQQSPRASVSGEYYDGSPLRQAMEASCAKSVPFMSSPLSISPPVSPPADSPPMSPILSRSLGSNSVNEMMASFRNLQLNKMKSMPPTWMGSSPGYGSPRVPIVRPVSYSLPSTPTRAAAVTPPGLGYLGCWDESCEEEPVMERVQSGRDVRARMFEKLSKENLERVNGSPSTGADPDLGWVSELVK